MTKNDVVRNMSKSGIRGQFAANEIELLTSFATLCRADLETRVSSPAPVVEQLVEALELLDKEWREFNEAEFGLQGEDNNRFYTPKNVKIAIEAGQKFIKENGK